VRRQSFAWSSTTTERFTWSFDTSPPPYERMNTVRHLDDGTEELISFSGYWKLSCGSESRAGGSSRARMWPRPTVLLLVLLVIFGCLGCGS
jgi:hypothetical protein